MEQENTQHRKTLAIIMCMFLGYMYFEHVFTPYFHPEKTQVNHVATTQSSQQTQASEVFEPEVKAEAKIEPSTNSLKVPTKNKYPADEQILSSGILTIENSDLEIKVSQLGARIIAAKLKQYKTDNPLSPENLNLVKHINQAPYPLGVIIGDHSDAWTNYRVVSSAQGKIVLEGTLDNGKAINKSLTLPEAGFKLVTEVSIAQDTESAPLAIEWTKFVEKDETSVLDPYNAPGYTWFDGQKAMRENLSDAKAGELQVGPVNWITIGDKYFIAGLLAEAASLSAITEKRGQLYSVKMLGNKDSVVASVYLGPKDYRILEDVALGFERNIYFGWTSFIAAPLLLLLRFFHSMFSNWGLAIVALTIVVRMALYPLNSAQFKQMKAMQDLKPEMDRIREQITDKQQQQSEMMAMYKKRGVNPLGGCLPVFIQMPIFIGLYSALMLAIELRHAPFALWIHDLSASERLMVGQVGIPVMVILFVLTMLIQQWTTPSAMEPAQKRMMMFMPLVFGFMFANMPAGLTLYWLTNNVIGIGQQKAMQHFDGQAKHGFLVTSGVATVTFIIAVIVTLL